MPPVVHVLPEYRTHSKAVAVGGLTTAAQALASLDPDHRLVFGTDLGSDQRLVHVHHALAYEAIASRLGDRGGGRGGRPWLETVHVLQRRARVMRGADEPTRSERAQVDSLGRAPRLTIATAAARDMLLEDHPEVAGLEARTEVVPLIPPLPVARAARGARPTVVAVTRFDRLKGTEVLVEVVARLLEDDVEVVVAGGLPDHGKYQRRWLEAFARAAADGARGRFVFAGWLASAEVMDLLASADALLAPSLLETSGLAVLEAMAAGCPVVASGIPAHRELLANAGLYADDAATMTEAVRALLSSPALADRLSGAVRDRLPDRAGVVEHWRRVWRDRS